MAIPDEVVASTPQYPDIHPRTPVARLRNDFVAEELERSFEIDLVAAVTGMAPTYIRHALEARASRVSLAQVLWLLDLDAFAETFVPRSGIPDYLLARTTAPVVVLPLPDQHDLVPGSAYDLIPRLPNESVQCVVTSTPYWGTRLYEQSTEVNWADGQSCAFGHEQTPEAFIRHTVELLFLLKRTLKPAASVWWNLMDTYNTRTQIRTNAAETLRAMQGHDKRGWKDYSCRRYSAGHSFLEDGEQCLIPSRVAERASRIGYWVKSVITWKKLGSMPETVDSRVTREVEYILHLSIQRTPYFKREHYERLTPEQGGRNFRFEADKLTDIWFLPTASGQDGHGAQFSVALPGRCIALSTEEDDLVLDPFVGAGTTSVAAKMLGRRSVGFDISETYLATANYKLAAAERVATQVALPNLADVELTERVAQAPSACDGTSS
jgi:DNA modification methylase